MPTPTPEPQRSLKELRIDAGLTLVDLAAKLDCSVSGPGSWERGKYGPRAGQFPKLAAVLGVMPADIRRAFAESKRRAERGK
jgi:transcriptional regulator with XRE-family HTH domain